MINNAPFPPFMHNYVFGILDLFLGTNSSTVAFIQYLQKFFEPVRDLAEKFNIILPANADMLFPNIALNSGLPIYVGILFIIGIITMVLRLGNIWVKLGSVWFS